MQGRLQWSEQSKRVVMYEKNRLSSSSPLILLVTVSSDVWIEGIPQSKECLADGFARANHRL